MRNYFTAVVENDDYSLDNQERYESAFCLEYDFKLKRILVDYRMPRPYDVSNIKEWKSTKDFDVVEKKMTKKEFAQLYEKILFDLVVRVSALIFESDTENMVAEVLFNASTVYEENPDRVSFFLSVVIPKKSYIRQDIKNYGFVSKQFVGQMKQVRYLDDIHKEVPPSMLTDTPPMKSVVPIRTLLHD